MCLVFLLFHLVLTDGSSVIRHANSAAKPKKLEIEIGARGNAASYLQEETSPRMDMGKNDTATLLENYASSLADIDKRGGDSVQCKFTIDNYVDSASYDGNNLPIKGDKNNWNADKVINFNFKSNAYLVVCGRNAEGNSCSSGGFAINCNRHVPGSRELWEAISNNNRRNGEGSGWHKPCSSSSGFSLPSHRNAQKMFAGNANPACFRWRTPDINCIMNDWSTWDECSKTCGNGTQSRTRGVKQNAKWGGNPCPAPREEKKCNEKPCPVDCEVNEWSDWGDCSETCGGGKMQHSRTVKTKEQHGGQACPILTNSTECNTEDCPTPLKAAARGGVVLSEMVLIYLTALSCFHLSARY